MNKFSLHWKGVITRHSLSYTISTSGALNPFSDRIKITVVGQFLSLAPVKPFSGRINIVSRQCKSNFQGECHGRQNFITWKRYRRQEVVLASHLISNQQKGKAIREDVSPQQLKHGT